MSEIEEARWLVVKAMLDEFPELSKKVSEYLSQQAIRNKESAKKPNEDIERAP